MFGNWHALYTLSEMYRNHPVAVESVPYGTVFMGIIFYLAYSVFMVWIINEESETVSNEKGD